MSAISLVPHSLQGMLRKPPHEPFPNIIGTFMGRDALRIAADSLNLLHDESVLFPAYLCGEVSKPFLSRCCLEFYDINESLIISPDVIQKRISECRPKALITINYFGIVQPFKKEIRNICSKENVVLIEDCAHSLLSDGSGETGDICIYSFRKTLPIPDGGGVRFSKSGYFSNHSSSINFYPTLVSNLLTLLVVAKLRLNIRNEKLSRSGGADRKVADSRETIPPQNYTIRKRLRLSNLTRNRMGNISLDEIVNRRRTDYQYWNDIIETENFGGLTPLFKQLPEGACPIGFPIRSTDRTKLLKTLAGKGTFLKKYWRLPSMVGAEFMQSHQLAREVFTLPVFPELNDRDKNNILAVLN